MKILSESAKPHNLNMDCSLIAAFFDEQIGQEKYKLFLLRPRHIQNFKLVKKNIFINFHFKAQSGPVTT